MFDEIFDIFVYKRKDKKIDEVIFQGVYRVIGDTGIEKFKYEMFNYACDGYTVEIEKMKG